MAPPISAVAFAVLLFFGMLIMLEFGRQFGIMRRPTENDGERSGLSPVENAVFALFGLIIAFTFSGAATRFSEKRMLIAEETNAIETAYLRLQLVPGDPQLRLQELFRKYLDSRLETYRRLPDMQAARLEMANSKTIQVEIWTVAIAAAHLPDAHPAAAWLLPPALNNMIDIATTRTMALQAHPPGTMYALLFGLGMVSALLAGYRMACAQRRSWLHILGYTIATVIVAYVTIDIEYPRTGLFRLNSADRLLVELRAGMSGKTGCRP